MDTVMTIARNCCLFPSNSCITIDISKDVHVSIPEDKDDPSNSPINNTMNESDASTMENSMENVMSSSMDIPRTSEVPPVNSWSDKGKEI